MRKKVLFEANALPDEKVMIVASFFVTNKEALAKLKLQWLARNAEHSKVIGRTKHQAGSIPESEFGGSIVLIDPDDLNRGFLMELDIPVPFGLCFNIKDRSLYVASGTVIRQIKQGVCVRELSNRLFNELHTITTSEAGNLLVTSTGVDAVLEVDFFDASVVCWDWLATEHGFDKTSSGEPRRIDRTIDYKKIVFPTPEHTTHINSALNDIPNKVLSTFFHQGILVEIDKTSKHYRVLLGGLKSPHNIRRREGGYILSDTRGNRVLLLDEKFRVEQEMTGKFDWVQDALEFDCRSYLVGDSNNDRIVKLNRQGKITACLVWPKGSRKFAGFEAVTGRQAREIFMPERSDE